MSLPKHSAPYWSNPSFNFLTARVPECQNLKGGLDQYGTEHVVVLPFDINGLERVSIVHLMLQCITLLAIQSSVIAVANLPLTVHHTSALLCKWQNQGSCGPRCLIFMKIDDLVWPCCQVLVPRHQRLMFGRWAFSVAGPTAWSSLPDSLQDPTRSFGSFCWDLKTFLFSFYQCTQCIRGFEFMCYINLLLTLT